MIYDGFDSFAMWISVQRCDGLPKHQRGAPPQRLRAFIEAEVRGHDTDSFSWLSAGQIRWMYQDPEFSIRKSRDHPQVKWILRKLYVLSSADELKVVGFVILDTIQVLDEATSRREWPESLDAMPITVTRNSPTSWPVGAGGCRKKEAFELDAPSITPTKRPRHGVNLQIVNKRARSSAICHFHGGYTCNTVLNIFATWWADVCTIPIFSTLRFFALTGEIDPRIWKAESR
ncbi:hypothetical protein DFH06DRAFT_374388 [Mycena polygramma]|nr:hypothetical protein DFH06DRAFT_374388 [Mycena polygramma]